MAMMTALTPLHGCPPPSAKRGDVDGENEKGKREGARRERGERGKLMRICACEQVSTLSIFEALFTINPEFQPTKHEPLCLS